MYAMTATFVAQTGQRSTFVEILGRAAAIVGQLPGCHLYAVTESLADDTTIVVIELWDDKAAHDASLQDAQVRNLIQEAMPLMAGPPLAAELNVVSGHGIEI